jgi:two-component system, sporulation sensor kinase E
MPTPKKVSSRDGIGRALEHLCQLDPQGLGNVSQKLARERGVTQAIISALREAVIVVDRWGAVELINPSAVTMLGLQKFFEDASTKKVAPSLWRAAPELARILKVGSSGAVGEFQNVALELELHYPTPSIVRLRATPLDDLDRLLIVLSDCSAERSSTTREVEDAKFGALTQLAAGVAHELGNPLNALSIHLELIERALAADKGKFSEKAARSLKTAQGELRRLDTIVRTFLQALRPMPPVLVPTDLVGTLEEVLNVLRAEFESAKITISVEVPGVLPKIMADPEQVKQVYFNLLKNAREAMESGGVLRIVTATDDTYLALSFIDSGKGIAAEHLTHLFEPYTTSKKSGSGLGLMIAQRILRAHGGAIEVESKPGAGTTVRLKFPLTQRRFRPLGSAKATPQLPKGPEEQS